MLDRLYTPEQVAKILQVHPLTVLKYIKAKRLKGSRIGRVYRVREKDLERFLDETA